MNRRQLSAYTHWQLVRIGHPLWTVDFVPCLSVPGRIAATDFNSKTIFFDYFLIFDIPEDEQTDTSLHEVAHVMVGLEEGHGSAWRKAHILLGGSGNPSWDSTKRLSYQRNLHPALAI